MSDLWEKQRLAEHRDQLVRSRQREAEDARRERERKQATARHSAAEVVKDGNLEAIRLHHELEPERRNWDIRQLIEEERIKLETYTSRTMVETREQIRLISAELVREIAFHYQTLERDKLEGEILRKQTTLERQFDVQILQKKATQTLGQTSLEHEQAMEMASHNHEHAKDFKTHETSEFIRLKKTFGEMTSEDRAKFFKQFESEAKKSEP